MAKWSLVLAILLFSFCLPARANDVYVASSASGAGNGSSCSNAHPYTWINSGGNWGAAATQIGPGTTVHICGGTYNLPAGGVFVNAYGSGTSSAPITFHFEPNAKVQAPYFSGTGAFYLAGRSWIVIDGNMQKGGVVQGTQNGNGLAYQQSSMCVQAQNGLDITLENFYCLNVFQHKFDQDYSTDFTGTAAGFYMLGCVNCTVTHSHVSGAGWAIQGIGTGFTLEYSEIDHMDHGLAGGAQNGVASMTGSIHDNHFHDMFNWDEANCPGSCHWHHDYIHIWGHSGAITSVITRDTMNIYNNVFDGDEGSVMTAFIFLQSGNVGTRVYNNVFVQYPHPGHPATNGLVNFGGQSGDTIRSENNSAYNNTFVGAGITDSANACIDVTHELNFTSENNVMVGCTTDFTVSAGTTLGTVDYNTYGDAGADLGSRGTFVWSGTNYTASLSTWRSECGCDAHSQLARASTVKLGTGGLPQLSSVLAGFGTNLTGMGLATLNHDIVGVQRPGAGLNWDGGAYVVSDSTRPSAPTGLTATVQ